MGLVWEEQALASGRTYAGFGVKLKPGHLLTLRFEFGAARLNALEWGICREHAKIQVDAAKAEIVADAMDGVFGVRQRGHVWPWYTGTGAQDHVLRDDECNWATSAAPWLSIGDKSEQGLVGRIVKLALEVRVALADVDAVMH